MPRLTRFAAGVFGLAALVASLRFAPLQLTGAQGKPNGSAEADIREHYTKHEFRIPMRDGVKLFTAVYVPKDTSQPYPFLIVRTPYSVRPYGADQYPKHLGPAPSFERDGFIFVAQDARGRFLSEGSFMEVTPHKDAKKSATDVDESTDTYDTIEWLLYHVPNNNGKAGIWGISYPGFYAAAGIIDSHPALKAASPQAPVTDLYMATTRITTARLCWRPTSAFILFSSHARKSRRRRPSFRASTTAPPMATTISYRWVRSPTPGSS